MKTISTYFGLLRGNAVSCETSLDIIDVSEVLTSLLNGDDIYIQ